MRLVFILISFVSILFISCEKETPDTSDDNALTIDGETIELTQAIILNNGEYNGQDESYEGNHMIFGVYSSEVTFITEDGVIDGIMGIGDGVEFEVFAENPNEILNQSYSISNKYETNTFSFAVVYTDFNFETQGLLDGLPISDGTLTISLSDNELTINSTLTLHPSGEIVTISYKGGYQNIQPV